MIAKRVDLTEQARRDVRQITVWYRKEGGTALAQRWVAALEDALRPIGAHPQTGATRYAVQLKLDDLRFWSVSGFPTLVFYVERQRHIDVGRVLHGGSATSRRGWGNHSEQVQRGFPGQNSGVCRI